MSESPAMSLRLKKASDAFARRCRILMDDLADDDFLHNRGLGNEVGLFVLCYEPALKLRAEEFMASLRLKSSRGELPCRVAVVNLYDLFLDICEDEDLTEWAVDYENQQGTAELADALFEMIDPHQFADKLAELKAKDPGVVILGGVGEVYPFLRLHTLFEALQQDAVFEGTPVVALYPGSYSGQSFSLFSRLDDGNYYRAFNLE